MINEKVKFSQSIYKINVLPNRKDVILNLVN